MSTTSLMSFLLKINKSKIWQIFCDGVPTMLSRKSGLSSGQETLSPERGCAALASKKLLTSLEHVFEIVVKAINLIGRKAINHRLFKNLFTEMWAEHDVLLFHSHVIFLSRGHVFQLRKQFINI